MGKYIENYFDLISIFMSFILYWIFKDAIVLTMIILTIISVLFLRITLKYTFSYFEILTVILYISFGLIMYFFFVGRSGNVLVVILSFLLLFNLYKHWKIKKT